MEFVYFHLMPYTAIEDTGTDWPVSNEQFDPVRGKKFYDDYIDNLVYAEECGFDWIGFNEHHMSPYGLMSNPNLIGAALIQRTSRVKIAIVGNLVPLLNPVRVAEEYAMLDVMSGGRLVAGILRGIPHEYVAYNVSPSESYSRLEEALQLIKKCWTVRQPFGWEGEHYQYRAISIWPRPAQQPMPPILMSGSNETSVRAAARHHAKLGIVAVSNLDHAAHLIKVYKEEAHAQGWEPQENDILIGGLTLVADTNAEAEETLERGREYFVRVLTGGIRTAQGLVLQKTRYFDAETRAKFQDIRKAFGRSVKEMVALGGILCGDADRVCEQLEALRRKLGIGVFNVNMKVGNIPDDAIRHSMEIFRDRIIPEFR
ncbi:MAG: LLM class flavin-dependent oxidoreductase [Proteobacteria bacterium]|nr:LLM class flavin-dependent oxidoreductase [Pseudomonadota bacterium]